MHPQIYQSIIAQEDNHWWFSARRAISAYLLSRLTLPPNPRILDAGCGGGGNLPLLSGYGSQLYAFEMDDTARAHAAARRLAPVEEGSLPDAIPFGDTRFDLITLFDVLEHVEDDAAALAALAARLDPGGYLLLTVPAFPELYGPQDELHHHHRRYRWDGLRGKLAQAGFDIEFMNYWNILLFPIAVLVRLKERLLPGRQAFGLNTPPPFINRLLFHVVALERFILPRITLPFGLSMMVVARKRGHQ